MSLLLKNQSFKVTEPKTIITRNAYFAFIIGFNDGLLCIESDIILKAEDLEAFPDLGEWYSVGDSIGLPNYYIIDIANKNVICPNMAYNPLKNRKKYLEAVASDKNIEKARIKFIHLKERIIWVETKEGVLEPKELVLENGCALDKNSSRYPVFRIEKTEYNGTSITYGTTYFFDGNTFINILAHTGCAAINEDNVNGLFSHFIKYSHTTEVHADQFSVFGNRVYFPFSGDLNVLERTPGTYKIIRLSKDICWTTELNKVDG